MIQHTIEFDTLSDKDLILTPNRRLCAWLVRDYEQWMLQLGKPAWKTPQALPLDVWLQSLYSQHAINQQAGHAPTLLTGQQCRVVWHSIVEREEGVGADIEGLVQLCIQARLLIKRWQLPDAAWQQAETAEGAFYSHCYRKFLSLLEAQNWIDQAGILEHITTQVELDPGLIDKVYLHGFNDLAEPALLSLKMWLEQSGSCVQFSNQERLQSTLKTISNSKYADQFQQALFWAIEQWLQKPHFRVGIVVPNLTSQRLTIRQFCEDIAAANPDAIGARWQDIINITAGEPLSKYPMVSHLLLLLSGLKGHLTLAEWEVLLKSPYFKLGDRSLEKLDPLARFELFDRFVASLKQQNRSHYNLAQLELGWQFFLSREKLTGNESPPSLISVSGSSADILPSGKTSGIGTWLGWLLRAVEMIGWGQQRGLSSIEYQVLQRFNEMLRNAWDLDTFLPSLSFSAFARELAQQTRSIVFQPQTETAPIQIMGVLEAAGLNFDALWVCECESTNWPQTTNPNPFIPRQTLVKFGMPGSGPERELVYAETILNGFRSAAKEVIFSWSKFAGEVEHALTPLLADLPAGEYQPVALNTSSRIERQRHLLQYVAKLPADEQGSTVTESKAQGGSALIKAQSLCPFKAFAEYRLGIKSTDAIVDGVKASDRGNLVHKVLEAFWKSINGYMELRALLADETLLDKHLAHLIEQEMVEFKHQIYLSPEALYELEQARTFTTIKNWLFNAEQTRLPFTIDRVEKRQAINIAGLELNLTVDRIDQLDDGRKVIIDYKTGSVSTSSWLGERPEEPQLPLYTLLDPHASKGLYFAIVKPEKSEWQGLGEDGIGFTGTKSRSIKSPELGWDHQVEQWKVSLRALAEEFLQGYAGVMPLKETTCQYCHLSPVCRIKEFSNVDS